MLRQLLAKLMSFILIWTTVVPSYGANINNNNQMDVDQLKTRYPNATFITVSPEEYPQVAENLRHSGYLDTQSRGLLHLAQQKNEPGTSAVDKPDSRKSSDCEKMDQQESASEESLQVIVDFSNEMMNTTGGGHRDQAAVVFVIIGVVLVVVWVLYVFKFLYDVATGFQPCAWWSELAAISSSISSDPGQHAYFNGLRYSVGFRDGSIEVGISAEAGYSDLLLAVIGPTELSGTYWLTGPVLRWRFSDGSNPHYFLMNFLAGSTEHATIGVIAQANMGLRFGLGDNLYMGLSWGAMNLNVDDDQGIVKKRDEFYYLYGLSMGYKF